MLGSCRRRGLTITLGQAEIQQRLEAAFPVEQEQFAVRVVVDQPQVILREGSDRIGLDVRVRVRIPLLREYTGRVGTTGKLVYRREDKAFYLFESRVERLEIDGLPPEQTELVKKPVEAVAARALEAHPIYRLQGRNAQETLVEYVLLDVQVRDGKVIAELGLAGNR